MTASNIVRNSVAVASPLSPGNCLQPNADGSINVVGSITASLGSFAPKGVATLSVSSTSSNVALPTSDTGLVLRNTGSTAAYFQLGISGVTATTSDFLINAGDVFGLDASGNTYIAGITASSTTTFEIWTGTGLISTSQAGGGGGSGGNVNLVQVGGASVALGQTSSAASIPVVLASNAVPAFKIDQTTPGTTNAVDVTNFPSAVDVNTGNATNNTQRVVLASNQPAVAVTGTFWQTTQPVSAASLPLPTGAATAAKQPALGTAGSASTDVLTVQGIASMIPFQCAQSGNWSITNISGTVSLPTGAATAALQTTINTTLGSPFQAGGSIGNTAFGISGTLPAFAATPTFNIGTIGSAASAANQTNVQGVIGAATAPADMVVGGGVYNSSPLTLTTGQSSAFQFDANGYLKVDIAAGSGSGGTSSSFGSSFPTTGTAVGAKDSSGNMAGLALDSSGNLKVNVAAGGAGGGAVYGPTAVGSAAANPPVLLGGTANAGATGNVQVAKVDGSGNLYTSTVLTAGSASIGSISNTSFAATQSGTWTVGISASQTIAVTQATASSLNATVVGTGTFAVQNTAATPAGSNVIGKVGIDQTTPGTTNLVAAGQSGTWTVQPGNTQNSTPWIVQQPIGAGKTILSATGTITATTDIVGAVTSKRIKVVSYSVITKGTSATTCKFQSNAVTDLWDIVVQAPAAGSVFGANLSTTVPGMLFGTAAGEKLTLNVSSADSITYAISYYTDDAT